MAIDKEILSIDFDDDDIDYISLEKYLKEDSERNKNRFANEINELGDDLLMEINEKQKKQNLLKDKYIKYILKHNKEYSLRQLNSFSISDVRDIYNEIKNNRNKLSKIFKFIFNV